MSMQVVRDKLKVEKNVLLVYIVLYASVGFFMNATGKYLQIAEFANWWQVLTSYILYLVPVSLFVREKSFFDQYLYGLFFLALLEIPGYARGTSIAHDNNILDQIFHIRNFSLIMVVWFALFIPSGNWLVKTISGVLFGKKGAGLVEREDG